MSYRLNIGYWNLREKNYQLTGYFVPSRRLSNMEKAEIIIYHTEDQSVRFEVRLEDETVWLTQSQMAELFSSSKQNISLHINNIFKEKELNRSSTVKEYLTVKVEGNRMVKRKMAIYSLDVIISVGYRVKSLRGTQFRIWANRVIKDYLWRGYAVTNRIDRIEKKLIEHEQKFDLIIEGNLTPDQGIFFEGQIFDAHYFISRLIKSAQKSIILIDNYIDESVLMLLSKRASEVEAAIYTSFISSQLKLDIAKFNSQYPEIKVREFCRSHDRFLIIDDQIVYHIGASLKDLGKKWFAFSKIDLDAKEMITRIDSGI